MSGAQTTVFQDNDTSLGVNNTGDAEIVLLDTPQAAVPSQDTKPSLKRKEPSNQARIPYGNKKSKSLFSDLTESLAREQELKSERQREKERSRTEREALRQETNLAVEKLRFKSEEMKREHERKMMEMQLEIMRMKYGQGQTGSVGTSSSMSIGIGNAPAGVSSALLDPGTQFDGQLTYNSVGDEPFLRFLQGNSNTDSS
jgi:hypothetical protein